MSLMSLMEGGREGGREGREISKGRIAVWRSPFGDLPLEIKIGAKWAKSFETISLLRKVGGPICSEWGKSFEPISLLTKVGIPKVAQK